MTKRPSGFLPPLHEVPPPVAAAIDAAHDLLVDAIKAAGAPYWRERDGERLHWIINEFTYHNIGNHTEQSSRRKSSRSPDRHSGKVAATSSGSMPPR